MTAIEFERAHEFLQSYGGALRVTSRDVLTLRHANQLQDVATKTFEGLANANPAGIDQNTRGSILSQIVTSAYIYWKLAKYHPVYEEPEVLRGAARVLGTAGRIAHKFGHYDLAVYCREASAGFFDRIDEKTDASFARVHAADSSMFAHRSEQPRVFQHARALLEHADVQNSSNPALQAYNTDICHRLRDETNSAESATEVKNLLSTPVSTISASRRVDRRQYGLQSLKDEWTYHGSRVLAGVASSHACSKEYDRSIKICEETLRYLQTSNSELHDFFAVAAKKYRADLTHQSGSDVRF